MTQANADSSLNAPRPIDSPAARWGGWVTTGLLALVMTFSGILYVVGPPPVVEVFHRLGYPDYFRTLLGVAKLLGVIAILGAPWAIVREWAYAGFVFDLLAGSLSHLLSGDSPAAIPPLVVLALLSGSYLLWHRPRLRQVRTCADVHALAAARAAAT